MPAIFIYPALGLRTKTEINGVQRSRTQTEGPGVPAISIFPAPGLRMKTEINGLQGSRTQTEGPGVSAISIFPASGLRMKTEINGFQGSRTQTEQPTGPFVVTWRAGRPAGKSKAPGGQNYVKSFTNIVESDIIYYKI